MKNLLIITIVSIFLMVVSCKVENKQRGISSGRIDYMITYLNADLDKKTMELLPKKMKLTFNEKQAENKIEGFLGLYKLNTITNFHTHKCSTFLKIVDKHYVFKGKRDELMCCFDQMDDMKIDETVETKTIAGLDCKKAVVFLPSKNEKFDIFYTGEINLQNPNVTNPYKNVNGILMEFELNLLHLRMRFTAENFTPLTETDMTNNLPHNAKTVNRDQMAQILTRLME
jgi:GLPGLI family protein